MSTKSATSGGDVGILDVLVGRADLRIVMRWGVYLRAFAAAALVVFATAKLVEPGILIFGAIDALSVAWAVWALRAEGETIGPVGAAWSMRRRPLRRRM
jgi:hypothetical protein